MSFLNKKIKVRFVKSQPNYLHKIKIENGIDLLPNVIRFLLFFITILKKFSKIFLKDVISFNHKQ